MSSPKIVVAVKLDELSLSRIREKADGLMIEAYTGPELSAAIRDCEILFGGWPTEADILSSSSLKWFQAFTAGVNMYPQSTLKDRNVIFTNTRGAHGPQIAENVFSMMLAFAVGIPDMIRFQDKCAWKKSILNSRKFELNGQTALLIGLGAIGEAIASRAKAFGMTVHGIRRSDGPASAHVDRLFSSSSLHEAISAADHIALSLPLTPDTIGYFGASEFAAMKPTAYLYNVGRGACIDRNALFASLDKKKIAGAGLDVTDPEPLPPDDPHWTYSNVILSQHSSGDSPQLDRRLTDIFLDNLALYKKGLPLNNLIDFEKGY